MKKRPYEKPIVANQSMPLATTRCPRCGEPLEVDMKLNVKIRAIETTVRSTRR